MNLKSRCRREDVDDGRRLQLTGPSTMAASEKALPGVPLLARAAHPTAQLTGLLRSWLSSSLRRSFTSGGTVEIQGECHTGAVLIWLMASD